MNSPIPEPERMQCMEIWGGNCQMDQCFRAPGMDISVYSRPYGGSSSGGGDIYYLTSCASGRISRFLLADVSGHGESVSDVAIGLRDLLRQNVNAISQERFVKEMNHAFGERVGDSNFATAVIATFFEPANSLAITVAGHPFPIYFRASLNRWVHLDPAAANEGLENLPLGIVEYSNYPGRTVVTEKDDMFLLYTDAFTESMDQTGKPLGIAGLLELLNAEPGLESIDVVDFLSHQLKNMNPKNLDSDDASMIVGAFTSTKVRMQDNLLAPVRLAKNAKDRTNLKFESSD